LIKESIRSSDYFGRWGGEEFLIILPDTSYENALKIAEKLRKKIAVHSFKNVKITSSFGVTEFKRGESVDNIMARADEALYEAKESGRNQVKGKK
jgi:diguanylate cyclase (GGDEF)-like protein